MNTEKGAVMADVSNKCFAADGVTPTYTAPGLPIMVSAVDFNRLYGQLAALSANNPERAEAVYCTRCEGRGYAETGVDESPTTVCNKCNGTGLAATSTTPVDEVLLRPVRNRCPRCVALSCLCDGACSTPPSGAAVKAEPVCEVGSWWNDSKGFDVCDFTGDRPEPGTKLYPTPQPPTAEPGQPSSVGVDELRHFLKRFTRFASEYCDHTRGSFDKGIVRFANEAHKLLNAKPPEQGRAADVAVSGKQQVIDALYAAWMREPVGETVGAIGNAIQYLQSEASHPPSASPVAVPKLLSESECAAVLRDPRGLIVLMDYHEVQQLESDSVGAETTGDDRRIAELKALGRAIIEADLELHEPAVLKEFGFAAQPALPDAGLDSQKGGV